MVELYELQSGILDRERQVVQPFADQGVGFGWLNQSSALLAFRTSELASIAVRSSGRETCLYKLRHLSNGSELARSVSPDAWPKPRRISTQGAVAKRLVLGALGGARAVDRRTAALPPPTAAPRSEPCGRSDLNFAPPWQTDEVRRQRALESSVQLFVQGSDTNLAMSFMPPWERKIVHAEAERLQLTHWSEGEEGSRRVILQKQSPEGSALLQQPTNQPAPAPSRSAPRPLPSVARYVPPAMRRQQQQAAQPPH